MLIEYIVAAIGLVLITIVLAGINYFIFNDEYITHWKRK